MGREESKRLIETLRRLRGRQTILLIEHDMDVVFALAAVADRPYIIEKGRTVWTGSSAALRGDRNVQQRYLGV